MADREEPQWPIDDRDEHAKPAEPDTGATAEAGSGEGATDELTRPRMALSEQPTLWVRRPDTGSPPSPEPAGQTGPPSQVPVQSASTHATPMRIQPRPEPTAQPDPTPPEASQPQPGPPQPGPPQSGRQPRPGPPPEGMTATGASDRSAERGRGRRGLLLGGTAVFLVIVVGVVLALPYVANRLGLPWAPNSPKADPPGPANVSRSLHGPTGDTPAPTPDGVADALDDPADNPALGTLTGSVLDPATGQVLWQRDAGTALTPASTTKLLTSAAALLTMRQHTQLSTKVVAGERPGTVVLVGGGDPTLSSLPPGEQAVHPGAAHLDDLVAQVKQATGGHVREVALDLHAYTGPASAPGWSPDDAPSTYAAPMVPAMLDGGRVNPTDERAMRTGNPARALGQEFADRVGATLAEPSTVTAGQGAKVLAEVRSAPLTELVDTLLEHSDNTLADAVARRTATAVGAEPSFEGSGKATLDVLSRNGFDVSGVRLSDGSGLSADNKVPARLLSRVLAVAAGPEAGDPRTAKLRPMLAGLPVAGSSGTLAKRYRQPPAAAGKGWVRAKTGTLSGVNTLAGVVLDREGRVLVYALMSSGTPAPEARPALDALPAALRACGCR